MAATGFNEGMKEKTPEVSKNFFDGKAPVPTKLSRAFPSYPDKAWSRVEEPNSSCLNCGSLIDPGRFEGLCPHCLLRMTLSGEPAVPETGGMLPPWLEGPAEGELPPTALHD